MYQPGFYGGMVPPQMMQPQAVQSQIIRVKGEAGARTLNLAPGCSALALDETAPVVWLCEADGAGYRTVTPFEIQAVKKAEPVDLKAIEERIKRLEAMIGEQSHTGEDGRSAAAKADDWA